MRIYEVSSNIQYVNVAHRDYEDDELDYDNLINQAEILVRQSGMNMLRNDEITDLAIDGDVVAGVLYSSQDHGEISFSIAVAPKYRNFGVAKRLYSMLDSDGMNKLRAELIPPYTMERFVIQMGFKLTHEENGFKVYEK